MGDKVRLNAAVSLLLIFCRVHCIDFEYRTFRCRNGTYINDRLICDDRKDCIGDGDGADEISSFCDKYGDNKLNCGPGKFRCITDQCANATARCNTMPDCSYGDVDEQNCGDEVNTYDCQLGNGKYLCHDGLRCLDFNYTCDGVCHCFDCSDENRGCRDDGYNNLVSAELSHQACFKTPKGPVCCSEFDSTCQKCGSNEICDQKCVQLGNKTGCLCDENYLAASGTNNTECYPSKNDIKKKILIYSTNNGIYGLNLFTNTNFTVKKMADESGIWLTSLTAFQDYVYYASSYPEDIQTRKKFITSIFKKSIASNETHEIMRNASMIWKINSIAVDWITHNVYYASHEFISVCSNDGRICEQLKSTKADFINLSSRHGLMFWISNGTLMKSSMDGSEEILIHTLESSISTYFQVIFMTVDELSERIYWRLDSDLRAIYSVNFNGGHKKVWSTDFQSYRVSKSGGVDFRFWYGGIYFDGEIYFIARDDRKGKICSIDKKTNTVVQRCPAPRQYQEDLIFKFEFDANLLYVYNPSLQRTKIPNPCPTSCAGLCLTRPSSNKGFLNYTCLYKQPVEPDQPAAVYNTGTSGRTETLKISSIVILCGFLIRRCFNIFDSNVF